MGNLLMVKVFFFFLDLISCGCREFFRRFDLKDFSLFIIPKIELGVFHHSFLCIRWNRHASFEWYL